MKIKYEFMTGESVEIEVPDTMEKVMIDFDKELKNSDRRETRRHSSVEDLEGHGTQFTDARVDILGLLENQEMKEVLHKALAELLPQQRELLTKVFFEGRTMADIAREDGVGKSAIQDRLNRTYKKLKNILK